MTSSALTIRRPFPGRMAAAADQVDARPAGRASAPSALARRLAFQSLPDGRVGAGELQVVDRGSHVQAGATDEDRRVSATSDVVDRLARELLVLRDAGRLGDRPDVEQMMDYPGPFRPGQLGRSDVHARIELHGIGVYHLAA